MKKSEVTILKYKKALFQLSSIWTALYIQKVKSLIHFGTIMQLLVIVSVII